VTPAGQEPPVAKPWTSRRYLIAALFLLYILMNVATWRRSGDLVVDWGRELYTPWRLSEGDVLYRDVASLFGPLASYVNALWFSVFGVSIAVIQAANILGIGLLSLLLYDVFRRISGHAGGILAAYLFLSMFAYSYMGGIFNFVTPYSHDATMGLALCVILVWLLMHMERRATAFRALGTGLACGLAWLTKPEIAVAAVATLGVGVLLLARQSDRPGKGIWIAILFGLLLPSAVAILAFVRPLGLPTAIAIPGEAFRAAKAARAWDIPFYYTVSGFGRPWRNLGIVVGSAIALVTFFGGLEALERNLRGRNTRLVVGLLILSLGAVGFVVFMDRIPWLETARPLPVLTAVISVFALVEAWKPHTRAEARGSRIGIACWSVLSLALLAKIALLARFHHFGFYLTLPATLLVAVVLVHHLPRWLPATSGQFVRSFAILLVGALSANALGIELRLYKARSYEVGPDSDRMIVFPPFVDARVVTVSETMDILRNSTGENSTVLVLPEGAMLNFWLRRPTPTPQLSFMPPEVARYGEAVVRQELLRSSADVVVRMERRFADYGADEFGDTPFGTFVDRWLQEDYCLLHRVEAVAEDFREQEAPRSVEAHPSHWTEIFARKGSAHCE
jgi:hypothetical protein